MAKQDIEYDLRLFNNDEFEIKTSFDVDSKLFNKFLEKSSSRLQKMGFIQGTPETPEEFTVDSRFNEKATSVFKKTIKLIQEEVKEDLPRFKILRYKVKEMKYTRKGNKYQIDTLLEGEYIS